MEMTKKPPATTRQPPRPSPFPSAAAEREELERALLSSSTASASAESDASSSRQNFVPTAVPIAAGEVFDENGLPVMAVEASLADLPPPPPAAAAGASAATSAATASSRTNNNTAASKSDKSEFDDDGVIVRPEPPSSYDVHDAFPTAPILPTHATHLPSTQQYTTSAQLRAANVRGDMLAEEELAAEARGHRNVKAERHQTNNAIKAANERAARKVGRSDEGLTVDEGIHRLNLKEEEQEEDEDIRLYGTKQHGGKGGYEVKEYDIGEYDTADYDVSEYKSVYD